MKEQKKGGNRAWVKNAAIIFLSVLLVLTFFSNTILNRSLPEVTGQYANGGEISTAVRGKGTVTANEAFSVTVDRSREIAKVYVKVGDVVEADQVLFELVPTDSAELEEAIKTLETLQYEYNKKILTLSKDYELEELKYALEDALEAQEKSVAAAAALVAATTKNDTAQESLRLANEEIKTIEDQIAALTAEIEAGIDEDMLTAEMKELKKKLENAKKNLESAKKQYDEALAGGTDSIIAYIEAEAAAAAREGTALVAAAAVMDSKYIYVDNPAPAEGSVQWLYNRYYTENQKGITADAALVNKYLTELLSHPDLVGITEIGTWKSAVQAHDIAQAELSAMQSSSGNLAQLKSNYEYAQVLLERAQKAWDDAIKDIRIEGKEEREVLRAQLKTKNTALVPITKASEDAKKELTKAEADASVTPDKAADAVRLAQRAIERKMDELESSEALSNLELSRDRDAISDQQDVVNRLRDKEISTEVKTRKGGTVLTVDVMAGDKTDPEKPLATIEVNGKGYTMQFSVSNEEVQRVRVGDVATISGWGRSDTICKLAAIKTDRENPTRKKILEFDVTGDNVTAGENLEISIGTRTQYYNYVVPNSAIREDADGKFVLIAVQKPTPLGKRDIATRFDVTVVDQDTKNSAITGDFEWSPFVITTSSKPIEPNTQVRLA